ncbi:hypothetical protein TcG_00191 [Trypanosoma cruzi]|nr:hypothetical protein TcG_00191 [Trypanosoma cruzi]
MKEEECGKMAEQDGASSPSPDFQVEALSSCCLSRAGSEAPHRTRESLVPSPRSCHSSCAGSEGSQRHRMGHSLRNPPGATPRGDDRTTEFDDAVGEGVAGVSDNNGRVKKFGGWVNNTSSFYIGNHGGKMNLISKADRHFARSKEASEMEMALYHSVPFAGGSFTLLQKLHYPFDVPETLINLSTRSSVQEGIVENAEYEATGELQATNGVENGATRSVVRNDIETIESCVSAMTMCMMPDPVYGAPVLALCVGDANGRVNYSELDVCHTRSAESLSLNAQKSKSNATIGSSSQTDPDLIGYDASLPSDHSFLYHDSAGFHRPPLRSHGHQAYVREMDCLTSVTISQAVKSVCFLTTQDSPHTVSYLTANERDIKLFRVQREGFTPFHAFPSMEAVVGRRHIQARYFPPFSPPSIILPVRVFSGCHLNVIQDLCVCPDVHSFLSADDLQVFLWNLESCELSKGMCVTDCRPLSGRMDEVEELVTSIAFSPTHSSIFLVSRSSGFLGIGDLRQSISGSQCQYTTSIRVTEDAAFPIPEQYSDILCSISGAKFLGPQHVVTRDYLSLKLWDLRRPDAPCSVAHVMSYVSPYLDVLYENDAIFDRFPIAVDHVSGTVVTGLYDGAAAVWQPLHKGRAAEKDLLAYYRVDPQALLCEVENGGRTNVEELSASLERDWKTPAAREIGEMPLLNVLPTPVAKKVTCASVADGGERFALTCKDGRCLFIFERKAFCDVS